MQIAVITRLRRLSDRAGIAPCRPRRNPLSILALAAISGCAGPVVNDDSEAVVRVYDAEYLSQMISGDFDWDDPETDARDVRDTDWLATYTAGAGGVPVQLERDVVTHSVRAGWTVLLKTFTDASHRQAAETMRQQIPTVAPSLGDAFVHTTNDASMVAYGFYDEPTNDDAQAGLAAVKDATFRGRTVFPRAMLMPIQIGEERAMSPYDLRTVRQQYPNIRDLYTLDIAVWGSFGSEEWTRQRIRETAEAFCMQLRAKGDEAYFYHNEAAGMSSVSIGVLDRRAYDASSQMLSSEVLALMRKFPYRLTNGEPLYILADPNRPETSERIPQQSVLSLIPES